MWHCLVCGEERDDMFPIGHRHHLIESNHIYCSDEITYSGDLVEKTRIREFFAAVQTFVDFKGGRRGRAIISLEHLLRKVPEYPINLREFVLACLRRQREDLGGDRYDELEGFDFDALMNDVNDFFQAMLKQCTTYGGFIRLTETGNPKFADDGQTYVYWAEDPEACAADCSRLLGEAIGHLNRLQLKGSKYWLRPRYSATDVPHPDT